MCKLINGHSAELSCRAMPGRDDVDTATNLRSGSLDLGLVDSQVLIDAIQKKGAFQFLGIDYGSLRMLAPVYAVPATLIVRRDAGIASLDDLAGSKVNAGLPGSSQQRFWKLIMQVKNWTRDDFPLLEELPSGRSEERMALCHGTIQATLHIGVHPDPWLQELFQRCPAGLTGLADRSIRTHIHDNHSFFPTDIPAGTYASGQETIRTIGTKVLLVASEDVQRRIVLSVLKALAASQKDLQTIHPAFSAFILQAPAQEEDGPGLHPGAAAYFRQRGFE